MRISVQMRAPLGCFLAILLLISGCKKAPESSNIANAGNETIEAATNVSAARDGPEVGRQIVPDGAVTFTSLADAHQNGESIKGALRDGTAVPLDSTDWPASFMTEFKSGGSAATCTAAMIGPGVMLTAAHCVPNNGKISFALKGRTYGMTCSRHPKWDSGDDPSADYGLCALDPGQAFIPPHDLLFEMVDTSPIAGLQPNMKIVLTGYGCASNQVSQSRIDGRYRIGGNSVEATSESRPPRKYPNTYYSPTGQRNNLFTSMSGANICPGDSGGPAFSAGSGGTAPRRIIGVNSRVFFADDAHQVYGASLIASLGGDDFPSWARKWLADRHLAACGLGGAPSGCRL